ncbi:hypothetical protein Y032_0888g2876 [Ancylostoma ceylanicum]|uniref:Uncharacterized protein n=1 Tax=Ancylostoma ceylanicum TaxID=53326 RepID=A0A016WB66_9BILA|nr:hypothetical protein Y032_0888g2876 [Ancylostoma ceylanicum]
MAMELWPLKQELQLVSFPMTFPNKHCNPNKTHKGPSQHEFEMKNFIFFCENIKSDCVLIVCCSTVPINACRICQMYFSTLFFRRLAFVAFL